MGNCFANEGTAQKSARDMASLHDLSHSDYPNRQIWNGHLQAYSYHGSMPFAGYIPAGYQGYRPQGSRGYPLDTSGRGYRPGPSGALMVVDPYTGVTYECDEDTYKRCKDMGKHHPRRKERGKSSPAHRHPHIDDDDEEEEKPGDEEDDEKRRRHYHQSTTANNYQTTTKERGRATGVKRILNLAAVPKKKSVRKKDLKTTTISVGGRPLATTPPGSGEGLEPGPEFQTTFRVKYGPARYRVPDVVISSSGRCHSDQHIVHAIRDKLEATGVTVWVESTSCHFADSKQFVTTGDAIIDTKLCVCIVSELSVKDSTWEDEVALAFVSNTVIFPVSLQSRQQLLPLMSTALQLQLADHDWMWLKPPDALSANLDTLVNILKAEMADLSLTIPVPERGKLRSGRMLDTGTSPRLSEPSRLGSPRNHKRLVTSVNVDASDVMPEQFWADHFGSTEYVVPWDHFTAAFLKEFRGPLERIFHSPADQRQLLEMLRRKLEVDTDRRVYKSQFMVLCSTEGHTPGLVWPSVQDHSRQYFAIQRVFRDQSSVWTQALHSLEKFSNASVIGAVRDMLSDRDVHSDVRSVVILALARTDVSDPETLRHILRMLRDPNPVVRGAAYLAVTHLKYRQAASQLMQVWQKDVLSAVSAAGKGAGAGQLRQLGQQELDDARTVMTAVDNHLRALSPDTLAAHM